VIGPQVSNPAAIGARGGLLDREGALAKLMIAPAILFIVAMIGVPFVLAVLYSLSDATTGDPTLKFVGLRNFAAALEDPVFRLSLRNTVVFTLVSQCIVVLLSRLLATALLKSFRGKWLVRFLIMLPWTAPISLGTIGWLWMLDSIFSPIDWVLRYVGLLGVPGALLGAGTNLYYLGVPGLAISSRTCGGSSPLRRSSSWRD
jgi:multiple sugar transport system permease protein